MNTTIRIVCFVVLVGAFSLRAAAEDFTNAIHAYLRQKVNARISSGCMVVGIVDEHGSCVISYGKLDNGTGADANGDTVFAIHSATGTFLALLLQEMVERGEMKLDDPVAKYLPSTVKVPAYQGQEITLRHLVKETSGLPWLYDELDPAARAVQPLADFTVEKMDALVSRCQLTSAPGTKHLHGHVDKGLLGQAMAMRAGTNFESLLVDRILRPLQMNSTRFTLTSELESRLAGEHCEFGYVRPCLDMGAVKPGFGLFSTANDMLKFLSLLALKPSPLAPIMQVSTTNLSYAPDIDGMFHTGGGAGGGSMYAAYDKIRRRGVVVFSTVDYVGPELGNLLLESEWQSDRRSTAANISRQVCNSYAGQYQRSPDVALGMFVIRYYFPMMPKAAIYIPAALCMVVLAALLWRAGGSRKRWLILGCATLVCGLLAPLVMLLSCRIFCGRLQPGISIYPEGDRLTVQATGLNLCPIEELETRRFWGAQPNPIDVLFPRVPVALLPESENRFFERLSGVPMDFSRDVRGRVTGLTMCYRGKMFSYQKVSDEVPRVPEPPKRPVTTKVDTKLLEACAGHYGFAPHTLFPEGLKVTIWREGGHLMQQTRGQPFVQQALPMYPESETNYFDKIYAVKITFIKNGKGEVTGAFNHYPGYTDYEGKKLKE